MSVPDSYIDKDKSEKKLFIQSSLKKSPRRDSSPENPQASIRNYDCADHVPSTHLNTAVDRREKQTSNGNCNSIDQSVAMGEEFGNEVDLF